MCKKINTLILCIVMIIVLLAVLVFLGPPFNKEVDVTKTEEPKIKLPDFWTPPDSNNISTEKNAKLIRYGKKLISRTSYYLGPKGIVSQSSNGMNCQNCHLDRGTKIFGNNYSAVSSTYPKFRARSGTVETMEKRINDCFERSLNGRALAEESQEMKAIVAYMNWLGKNVSKGESPQGSGLIKLDFLERKSNIEKGKTYYEEKCSVCHGKNGEGKLASPAEYQYPPLWHNNSFNNGAGLFRISRFASYIKTNMPLSATYDSPILNDEEAWDIAAYILSRPRPTKNMQADWPDISKKPFDHPFGPYADKFSQDQHKYGPFQAIIKK